ncbi:MAG: zinc ABC transporter substrate-binding protein ZnuA [Rhizobiales bacterium]|nr:zinc ABC transporter substrate-binding protein ZnuA [Hyphomicrobiales bacterium]
MTFLRVTPAACLALLLGAGPAAAFEGVVASIKPIHALVAGVMKGIGEPELLLKGAASPHTYALRPSDAAALSRAKLVFWVGPNMEAFLAKPLESLAAGATTVELDEAEGVEHRPLREGGAFEADDDEGGKAHEAHDHGHGEADAHVWLDPENARAMVAAIGKALAGADPANAAAYAANAAELSARLDALSAEIAGELAPVRGKGFVVFHDAYQYFEKRFGMTAVGSITVSPEVMPGAARIAEIRDKVKELDVACVFAEPQFEPRLIEVITEGTGARAGVLDPEASAIEPGPDLYFEMLRGLAASLRTCLAPAG